MWRRVLRLRSGRVAVGLLLVIALVAVIGPYVTRYDPLQQSRTTLTGPSGAHLFGTDYVGRDVFSRLLAGARISVLGSVEVALIALVVGTLPGILSVYLGRVFEWVSLRLVDTLIALPFLVFAVAITALLGNGIPQAMLTVGFLVAPMFYRVTRAAALPVARSQYVEAATLSGASVSWIIRRHVWPKILPPVGATLANAMGTGFIVVSSLTFLGIGVKPPAPSWGGVLASDISYLAYQPWAPLYALVPILATVWAFNLLADVIRDVSGESGRTLTAGRRPAAGRALTAGRTRRPRLTAEATGLAATSGSIPATSGSIPAASGSVPAVSTSAVSTSAVSTSAVSTSAVSVRRPELGPPNGRKGLAAPRHRPATPDELVLSVSDLSVGQPGGDDVVGGVSFELRRGRVVGLVGESGSGKTITCRTILGLLPGLFTVTGGEARLFGIDVATLTSREWTALRGSVIAAVFQDPASYLNPSIRVGRQVAEVLRVHQGLSRRAAKARAIELFADVRLRDPHLVYAQYPHQLSGGMLQRVLLASAIALGPQVLIADEVTTALDVTVQSEILDLIADLRERTGLSLVVVSHDLAVVAQLCDEVLVLRDGEVVERGPTDQILFAPAHEYTRLLVEEHQLYGLERFLAGPDPLDVAPITRTDTEEVVGNAG